MPQQFSHNKKIYIQIKKPLNLYEFKDYMKKVLFPHIKNVCSVTTFPMFSPNKSNDQTNNFNQFKQLEKVQKF